MKDMSDSREMLEARPHSFVTWFIYILITLILVALTWSYFGGIEEYVKATGSVRPGERISTIRNAVSGRVDRVYFVEGSRVVKGDVLYTIELNRMLLERDEKTRLVAQYELDRRNLLKYHRSILEERNLFGEQGVEEPEYFNRVQKYLNDRKLNIEQIANAEIDMEQMKEDAKLSKIMAEDKLDAAIVDLSNRETLLKSVKQDENLFALENAEYYNRYENYLFYVQRLNDVYAQYESNHARLSRLFAVGGATRAEVEDALRQLESARLEIAKYKNEYIINLQDSIKLGTLRVQELTNSLQKWLTSMDAFSERNQSAALLIEKKRIDMLVQIEDSLTENSNNLELLLGELRRLEVSLEEGVVKAPINGIVNMHMEINRGDLLQSGTEIAVIVPDTSSEYVMQLMISNKDIAGIRTGQTIKYRFLALPYREYGELDGVVRTISADARVDPLSGISYYQVEATITDTELVSHTGNVARIKVGMACDAQVITKSKKILFWLLEKINLMD